MEIASKNPASDVSAETLSTKTISELKNILATLQAGGH